MTEEFALLESLHAWLDDGPGVLVGPGDDAAVVAVGDVPVVAAVDAMVEDVHVDLAFSSLADLGYKALAVNVSDLAAVAARPVAALVCLLRPPGFGRRQVRDLYEGLSEAGEQFSCPLVGGDVVSAPRLAVSVSVLGRPEVDDLVLRRRGARVGDVVVVVGELGLAAAGLASWRAGAEDLLAAHPGLAAAHRRPVALLAAVPVLADHRPTAGIDVSDGLGRDLGHLAAASDVGIQVEVARLPVGPAVAAAAERLGADPLRLVVGGGDDYALAITLPPGRAEDLAADLAAAGLPAHAVGVVVEGSGVVLDDGRDISAWGWQHG